MVTWSTKNDTKESIVEYGIDGFITRSKGTRNLFIDGGDKRRQQYIHRVYMKDLKPGKKYGNFTCFFYSLEFIKYMIIFFSLLIIITVYHCGSELGWSNAFYVRIPPDSETWKPQIVIFGDMGNENAQSLARLQEDTQKGLYDAAIHVGDFAYDMNTDDARVGDEFMRQIESVAAYLPYMTVPGNHEEKYNFSNYR